MIRFTCPCCGAEIFFDSRSCGSCKSLLAFDPRTLKFEQLQKTSASGTLAASNGNLCQNGTNYGVCNWLAESGAQEGLCYGCQFNRTIPNLSRGENLERWQTIEAGKKRLLFSIIRLGLPLNNGWEHPNRGLLFDFLEDTRSSPSAESFFETTGFLDGVITLNVLEADPALRFVEQKAANEVYRTVLGHLRHEIGHYFFTSFCEEEGLKKRFEALFGDIASDYSSALDHFYAHGPKERWEDDHITPYASAHPSEDWAETWGHYLHIHDTLETAASFGLIDAQPQLLGFDQRIDRWRALSVGVNELNRSMGLADAYPFVINPKVEEKLGFAAEVAKFLKTMDPSSAAAQPPS